MIFTGHPAGAIFVDLFFPDGHYLFDPVHHFVTGVKGFLSVRSGYGDDQGNLPDIDQAGPGSQPEGESGAGEAKS